MKIKKKFIILVCILLFLLSPLFQAVKSYTVMLVYSKYEEYNSLLKKENIIMDIPGGLSTWEKDWYPFVIVFTDNDGFSRYMNQDLSLTILYNFGAFDLLDGASSFYNPDSDYIGSFYGGYIVKQHDGNIFGFNEDGSPNIEDMASVPKYDLQYLVLNSIGCYDVTLQYETDEIKQNVQYLDNGDWTRVDASITTNSPIHKYSEKHQAYLQYGKPPAKYFKGDDFPITELKGRIYARYFEEFEATLFLYVIAPNQEVINKTDEDFLSKSNIKSKN